MRDMYKSMEGSMKMVVWCISDLDGRDGGSGKYRGDGIVKFGNVRDLYSRIVEGISNCNSVEDMLKKVYWGGKREMEEENSCSMM